MEKISITDNISYIPASENPLSCDVVFIKTKNETWIFDTGVTSDAAKEIKAVEGKKNIVISHFHPDHIFNLARVSCDNLYVSKNTKKYTLKGTVVSGVQTFDDITLMELPSCHAKGCLILICGEYAFLGDGTYVKPLQHKRFVYNAQLLLEMIKVLEKLEVTYLCMSHDPNFVQRKEIVLKLYKGIYSRRDGDNPIIDVTDFFNPDGSVK